MKNEKLRIKKGHTGLGEGIEGNGIEMGLVRCANTVIPISY